MKRFTLIVVLVLIAATPMFAKSVTSETARIVATTFLSNNGAKSTQLTDLSNESGFPNLYIFNAESGFVVMAADDRVQPILGYSLTGKFVAENMPANVSDWLQGYNDEIQYAIDNKLKATSKTTKLWKELIEGNAKAAIATVILATLIQTKWNQKKYYNSLCPAISDGPDGHAYTGCTATSMAQIMKYHNYPSKGIGSHSYSWNGQNLTADFGATTYDWNNMVNHYNYYYDDNGTLHWLSTPSSTEIIAVATLMYHCGVSANMNYSSSGSGASLYNAANALKYYFNYNTNLECKAKSSYEDDEWKDMIKNELNASRPLQYAGYNPEGSGGHAFVCDGYDNADYFHFNWGWAGHYDGYFSLSNLDTGANSSDPGAGNGVYTRDQEAIFGIQPVQCSASAPYNLTYSLSGIQDLTLSWTSANGAASYNIYRNNIYIGNSTTNSFTESAPFGTDVYYVRSVDSNGELSLSSNYVTITVEYKTPIVEDLEASLSGNNISLSWTAPEWCYPETPSATMNYGTGNPRYLWTYTYYGQRYLAADLAQYAGKAIYKISTYIKHPGTYSLYIYTNSGFNTYYYVNNDYLSFSKEGVIVSISNGWYDFELSSPIILTGADDLWVIMKQENTGESHPVPSFDLSPHNVNAFYRGWVSNNRLYLSDANSNYDCAWLINTYLTDGTYTYNLYDGTSQVASNINATNYTISNAAGNIVHRYTLKTNYYGGESDASNMAGLTMGNASLSSLTLNANDKMTITEGSKLTVSGTLSDENADNLILENGAQLVNSSTGVLATVKKNISGYTQDGDWNLLALPFENVTPAVNNGLLANNYDLYTFDQSEELEWRNIEAGAFNTIDNKTGYLYANSSNLTLSLEGTLVANTSATTLTYDNNAALKGFNLIGNPYPCNTYVDRSFYVLNEDGSDFALGSNPIPPCSAILLQAQGSGESVTFNKNASKSGPNIAIAVTKANTRSNAIVDQARVSFNEKDQLIKYTLSGQNGKLYIPQNGQDFAVAYANKESEMPINFKAAKSGTYTIRIETEGLELGYLHLIDNLTGNDVDLLATPSYTFKAKTSDYATRFKLVFDNNGASISSKARR